MYRNKKQGLEQDCQSHQEPSISDLYSRSFLAEPTAANMIADVASADSERRRDCFYQEPSISSLYPPSFLAEPAAAEAASADSEMTMSCRDCF